MVQVINGAKKYIQCKACYANLEYELEDIKRDEEDDNVLHMTIITTYIQCPLCGEKVKISYYGRNW